MKVSLSNVNYNALKCMVIGLDWIALVGPLPDSSN